MSAEDFEIHHPPDVSGKVKGNGRSSLLQTGNGIQQGRRIPSLGEICSPSEDDQDGNYSPGDVTNTSSLKELETALIRVPVEH